MVCMKYKTVEKKVKPYASPLTANSEQKRKEVSGDLTLQKYMEILDTQTFTDESRKKLRIGGGGFLVLNEEE